MIVFFILILFSGFQLFSQNVDRYVPEEVYFEDFRYVDFISSVRFYPDDSEVDYPVLDLQGNRKLILEFDDLQADNKNYFYKIIHCDYDWKPSENISALDYIDGYQENRFYESTNSFNTRKDYTHYQLRLPNDDVKFKLSGNYLLKIYINDDENDLVLTRRFVVFEPMMKAVAGIRRSAVPPYSASHQEMSVRVEHAGIYLPQPATDVKIAVLQNGRWEQSVKNISPTFIQEESILYDLQGKIMFPGYKEFRPLDIRSFRHRGPQVEVLEQLKEGFNLFLFPDIARTYAPYLFTNDLNGKFIINSFDQPAPNERGEYGKVRFSLNASAPKYKQIYVVGGFSDFRAYTYNKMKYNSEKQIYELDLFLKNGFYDYYYAVSDKDNQIAEISPLEGSNYETENDYLIFVYYKKYGGRYDQVVAFTRSSSTHR